ncbi:MAG: lytic transglycosylase domain-containing protein [Roseitalea sp.]|jgi:hypothetical protein|nr:lytic transglycosylase domain-containing protein [Roseitalea sp.]MBO6720904.1 lytic transglycosylase domain-containing protein [Roseitalea sp.]MBO6743209.1 lytic transglycosylase domain-containing protein [Roseitalea sp.]
MQRLERRPVRSLSALLAALFVCFVPATSWAVEDSSADEIGHGTICSLIARAAERNGLPPAFFARLIWKESRFDPLAVSPKGAEGIAQFMPATAVRRGLENSFDPAQALPASATYLAALRLQFGNLGLAAAAYNAGEARIDRWLVGASTLPLETENYVLSITGEPAESFIERRRQIRNLPLEEGKPFEQACVRMASVAGIGVTGLAQTSVKPWGVQVAGGYRRAAVMRQWDRIRRRHSALLAGLPVNISRQKSPLGPKPVYAVRIGADSRIEANAICGRLRAAGGACVVTRN